MPLSLKKIILNNVVIISGMCCNKTKEFGVILLVKVKYIIKKVVYCDNYVFIYFYYTCICAPVYTDIIKLVCFYWL